MDITNLKSVEKEKLVDMLIETQTLIKNQARRIADAMGTSSYGMEKSILTTRENELDEIRSEIIRRMG